VDITAILIQIIGGAIGGNAAGSLNKDKNMGASMNSVLGAVGGVLGGQGLGGSGFLADFGLGGDLIISAVCGLGLIIVASLFRKM
jgi:uncharacterized membrane protein YeaQ/YmgE (transglycosylase-associated protein family)